MQFMFVKKKESNLQAGANRRKTAAYLAMYSAGKRLMDIIESHRDGTNKDIAKLTSQITSLCDKWENK